MIYTQDVYPTLSDLLSDIVRSGNKNGSAALLSLMLGFRTVVGSPPRVRFARFPSPPSFSRRCPEMNNSKYHFASGPVTGVLCNNAK